MHQPAPPPSRTFAKRLALVATALLALVVIVLAVSRYHEQQRSEAQRREIEERLAIAGELEQAGNLDAALAHLREAAAQCASDPSLEPLGERLTQRVDVLETTRAFLNEARDIQTCGALELGPGVGRIERRCADVLELHQKLRGGETLCRPEALADIDRKAADVRIVLAMRRVLSNSRHAEGRVALRSALDLLQRVEEMRGPSYSGWLLRAECQRRLGDAVAAERSAEQADRPGPRSAEDFYVRGYLALVRGPDVALEEFRLALQREPGYYPAHVGRLLAYQQKQDWTAAAAAATACLALRPGEAELFHRRGVAQFSLNEYQTALDDFDACLSREPKHRHCLYGRGRLHFLAGRWSLADRDFSAALAIDPEPSPYRWRGLCRAQLGRHREAAEDAEKALKLQPGGETTWYAARTYGRCVRAVQADTGASDRTTLADRYGNRAIELLRAALRDGFARRASEREILRAGADLDAIRNRPDFAELLRDVEARDEP
jgi:tetratricopeptide (TPR) repeat protein